GMVLEPLPSSQFSALMACPALYQDQHYGFLLLGMPVHESDTGPNRGFSDEQLRLINRVMDQVGVAINQTHQWETIQAANIKLSKLDELKSNLIDTVSHELRTPLTSIKGYTSRLLRYESNL